jgi:hypothetical protein
MAMSSVGLSALVLSPSPDFITSCGVAETLFGSVDLKLSSAVAAAQLALSVISTSTRAKADAWAPDFPSGPSSRSGGCPLGYSNPAVYKQYPLVHLPSTVSLLTPKQLLWLFIKNSGIVLLLQV